MEKKLKVVIVGAGHWGRQHARVFAARADVELVGVFSRSAEKAAARAAEFGTRPYSDLAQMLTEENPDFVSVSLPNEAHFEPTLEIIHAGIPLLVEKPLVFDLKEADTLIAEASARNLFFAINFNHRYAKTIVLARNALADVRVGKISFAWWRFGGNGGLGTPFANLIETQCHGFDQLEDLCGPIDSIMAEMTDQTTTLVLALHFASGAVGAMIGTYDSSYAYQKTHQLEINGSKGRILIEDTVQRYTYQPRDSEVAEVWQAGYFNDFDREFHRTFDCHLDAVLKAFRQGAPPPIHARAGQRALQLAHAAIESFQTGRRVKVACTCARVLHSNRQRK
jgi:myo-inositol 2-dehydrogenase/D-chiro-inositol 1-dehydrogenase